jgi:hypothetical protein
MVRIRRRAIADREIHALRSSRKAALRLREAWQAGMTRWLRLLLLRQMLLLVLLQLLLLRV